MRIILASSSPRRKEILTNMGVEFEIIKPIKDENKNQKLNYRKLSEELSFQKAKEIFDQTSGDRIIIGSDCMVYKNKTLLGKPKNDEDAFNMLCSLSGSWHKVVTGLCVMVFCNGEERIYKTNDVTKVKFKKLSKESIDSYIASGEPKDKAGSYAIQGKAGMFVEKVKGNLSTVIGIPSHKLYDILKKENILK